MTRKEYMQRLANALSPLPEKTREAALVFCQEMLDDRMEDGMDEEAAVAAMESPETLALRLGGEMNEPIDMGNLKLPNREDYLEFARLSDEALEGVEKALEHAKAPARPPEEKAAPQEAEQPEQTGCVPDMGEIMRQAMEAARQGIEMGQKAMREAMDSVQEAKPAGSFGNLEQRTLTCSADALRGVRLTCGNMPVVVRPCSGNTAALTYYTSPEEPYQARVENGELILEKQGGKGGFIQTMFGSGFKFLLRGASPTVELALPVQALVDLSVHTTNGSIKAGGFPTLCAVSAQTSNSRIEMKEITCKSMQLKSSNGRLVMEEVKVKQALTAVTSNSRIEAHQVRGGAEMTLKSSNGAIEMQDTASAGALTAVTSNGHIKVENVSAAAVTLKTSNGSVRGVLPGRPTDYAIDSGTSNGKNTLPRQQPGAKPLSVHTSNGNIDVRFEEQPV